ncbi:MAG: SAM-dependent chlorinase/fluorinase [Thermoplasmata archaeon]
MRSQRRPALITLTTDIGWAYAAQMKAVLSRYVPLARVVDLAHDLTPHRIDEAGFLLEAMGREFPRGTIHVAVVDPGVGGNRRALLIECRDGTRLLGPDNGVLMPLAQSLGIRRSFALEPARVGRPGRVGTTFDGRDLFAPAAGRLVQGEPPERLGHPVRPKSYHLPVARMSASTSHGSILHIDRFGNLITNIPSTWVPCATKELRIRLGRRVRQTVPWVRSYEMLRRGNFGALGSSFGTIEFAIVEENASRRVRAQVGNSVEVSWAQATHDSPASLVRKPPRA